MPNYRVTFEHVGIPQGDPKAFRRGEVVSGGLLGDINYLIRVGAVEETEDPESRLAGAVDMDSQITDAVSKAVEGKDAKISDLEAEIEMLNATNDSLTEEIATKNAEIDSLKAQIPAS